MDGLATSVRLTSPSSPSGCLGSPSAIFGRTGYSVDGLVGLPVQLMGIESCATCTSHFSKVGCMEIGAAHDTECFNWCISLLLPVKQLRNRVVARVSWSIKYSDIWIGEAESLDFRQDRDYRLDRRLDRRSGVHAIDERTCLWKEWRIWMRETLEVHFG